VAYALEIHNLAQSHIGGFYSVENELWQENKIIYYLGGTNNRSWFFLVITAFLVGYIDRKNYIFSFLLIFMTITVSYLLLSRGALIFGIFLMLFKLYTILRFRLTFGIIVVILLLLPASIFYNNYGNNDSFVGYSMSKKIGFSNRDNLVFEGSKIVLDDLFIGRGFHYANMNKEDLKKEGYTALAINNPQNTLLSIAIELGFFGALFYSLFWFLLYKKVCWGIKNIKCQSKKNYLKGAKLMIVFIFFSSLFVHFIEKSFTTTPIYLIILSLALKLAFDRKKEIS